RPMLAGRPHEAAGNGSPRWMTAAPRKRAHRTRPTGRLTPFPPPDLRRCAVALQRGLSARPGLPRAVPVHAATMEELADAGNRAPDPATLPWVSSTRGR